MRRYQEDQEIFGFTDTAAQALYATMICAYFSGVVTVHSNTQLQQHANMPLLY
jgi:hypothetical protein